MARKLLTVLGAFIALTFATGSHCNKENTVTGMDATATPAPTARATNTPAPATSTPTPSGPTATPAPPTPTLTAAAPTVTLTPAPPTATPTSAPATVTPAPPTATPGLPTATPVPGAPTITGYESSPPAHPGDIFDIYGTNVDTGSCTSTWFLKASNGTTYNLVCQFGSTIDAQLQIPTTVPTGTYTICVKRTDNQQACSSFTVTLS